MAHPKSSDPGLSPHGGAFAHVVVGLRLERRFDYLIPAEMESLVRPGCRVVVPFGHREITGYVLSRSAESAFDGNHKAVLRVLDERPTFSPEMLGFLEWAASYYHVPVGRMLERSIPRELKAQGTDAFEPEKTRRMIRRTDAILPEELKVTPVISRLLEAIAEGPVPWSELRLTTRATRVHLDRLLGAGLVEEFRERLFRSVAGVEGLAIGADGVLHLTDEQQAALDRIGPTVGDGYAPFLLHGVTGSGKTELYLRLAALALERGHTALVLVPEIALTPQLMATFQARFGDNVAVLHSALSPGQRYDQWCLIAEGARAIVLGARSAIFAPLARVGLIVVDEEHEPSFKQAQEPYYNARDLALVRGREGGATVVLGSATPSLESYHNARLGKLTLVSLRRRATRRPLPDVDLVDMRRRRCRDSNGVFSDVLAESIEENHAGGGQTILFLNRRGYAPFLLCTVCGHVPPCPDCAVSLTYHEQPWPRLTCHYCDHSAQVPATCPACGGGALQRVGYGLQRAAESVGELFPELRCALVDGRTGQGRLMETLERFKRRQLDVLLGTQILAKGHDFPGVSLVGVLMADLTLGFPDIRGAERTFQLLTQVAGRSGRGDRAGRVLVQTYMPQHASLICAQGHDFEGFAEEELRLRKMREWPPWTALALVRLSGTEDALVEETGRRLVAALGQAARATGVEILGPTLAPIARIRTRLRVQILLKAPNRGALQRMVTATLPVIQRVVPGKVRCDVDVDPIDMM
ncbi:MAG: primosomal protein N' [Pseudomonadota bacterium]